MSDARTVVQIREDIAQHRQALTSTGRRLEEAVKRNLDWRTHVSQHPVAASSLAAGVGLLGVWMLHKRRMDPWERAATAFAGMVADVRDQLGECLEDLSQAARGTDRRGQRPYSSRAVSVVATALAKVVVDLMDSRRAREERRHDGA